MDKKKIIYEIIKIICTAIISITAVLTAQSCTMSLSVSKNNSNSTQKTEQTTTSSVDSTQIFNFCYNIDTILKKMCINLLHYKNLILCQKMKL